MDTDLLQQTNGTYVNYDGSPIILLKEGLDEKTHQCILAEEIGHHMTTVGDITDQNLITNIKQEIAARRWAYSIMVTPADIADAVRNGASSVPELADDLGVTEPFLLDAMEYMKLKKGPKIHVGDDILILEPIILLKGGDPLDWISA